MKTTIFRRFLLAAFSILLGLSSFAQPSQIFLIGGPVNKNNPNWTLNDKVELSKDPVNPFIFNFKGYLAYNWRGDERGNMKFLTGNNWEGAYHPAGDADLQLKGITSMRVDGADNKWFLPSDRSGDGYYEFSLNTSSMTLTVDSFRADPYPERIYAVGASLPCGWNNSLPEVMNRINPETAVYQWSGTLSSGDFKFLTPLSIGNWDFCYDAANANEAVRYGQAQTLIHEVRGSDQTTFNDYKFIMSETAECTITVDLTKGQMTVTKNGELYAKDLWICGTAIPGGKSKLAADNIDPLINYHYYGELQTGSFKIRTTETPEAGTKYYVPTGNTGANFESSIEFVQTADSNLAGWSVNQACEISKVKLNTLTNKYKGSIFSITHVYIVGGATAVGWNAGNAIELNRGTGDSIHVYTFDGNLAIGTSGNDANKFKFLLQKDWGPASFHSQTENESITTSQFITDHVSDDYKWTVDPDKQGRYIIKVNALEETIHANYIIENPTGIIKTNAELQMVTTGNRLHISNPSGETLRVSIYSCEGQLLLQQEMQTELNCQLNKGLYIVNVANGNQTGSRKIIISN